MSPSDLWRTYVRPMGAGAVATAGLITLLRTAPTIVSALTEGLRTIGKNKAKAAPTRTTHDLPPIVVLGGSALLILLMFLFLQFHPVPGAQVGPLANIAASLLVVLFGFLFVTVSARIVGIVGSSASPVSGMTIATLMATAAIFLVKGWTAPAFGALAITIGGIVCIAASNAGDTAQDLKTGYLIGATPWKQQIAIMFGVIISVFSIGATLNAMNTGLESFERLPRPIPFTLPAENAVLDGVQNKGPFTRDHIQLTAKPGTRTTSPEAAGASIATTLGSHPPPEANRNSPTPTNSSSSTPSAPPPSTTANTSTTPPPKRSKSSGPRASAAKKPPPPRASSWPRSSTASSPASSPGPSSC